MYVRFTWTTEKNRANARKHDGITFELAQEVFDDPNQVILENYSYADESEQRFQIIGMTQQRITLLAVVFVDRSNGGEEIIHIVSARKATAYEENPYQDQFR